MFQCSLLAKITSGYTEMFPVRHHINASQSYTYMYTCFTGPRKHTTHITEVYMYYAICVAHSGVNVNINRAIKIMHVTVF